MATKKGAKKSPAKDDTKVPAAQTNVVRGPGDAIGHIIEQTKWRTRQDIDSWRGAIMVAENVIYPQRIFLYTLYDEVVLDGHVEGIIGQRKDSLLAEKFKLVNKDGEPLPEVQAIFENEWFYDFMEFSLSAEWWGHALIQLWDPIKGVGYGSVQLVPRRHVVPERGGVSVLQGDNVNLINYRVPPYSDWTVEVGRPRELGLLKIAAPGFIFKKNALLQWSQYTEIFGMPFRVGKTSSRNQADLDRMGRNLKEMGAAAYAVFQEGESIDFYQPQSTSNASDIYDKLIQRCNSELSKLILRQTMTIEDGSSLSQSEVHERVMEVLKEADKRKMKFTVNKLIPKMVAHGLIPEGARFEWEATIDLEELWKKVAQALPFFNVDKDWINEMFGIPVEDKPQQLSLPGAEQDTPPDPEEDDDNDEGDEPPVKPDKPDKGAKPAKKKSLAMRKVKLFDINRMYLKVCKRCGGLHPVIKLSSGNTVDVNTLARMVYNNQDDEGRIDTDTYMKTATTLWDGFKKGYGTGFESQGAAGVAARIQNNLYSFSAAKTFTQMNEMRDQIYDGDKVRSFDEFRDKVAQMGVDFNETYLQTEYNTTVSSGQLADRWQDYKDAEEQYPNLQYTTVRDDRVREAHRVLDYTTLPMNDPFWNKYYPPNDWNCRCTVIQMDADAKLSDAKEAGKLAKTDAKVPPLFQNNVGKSNVIFKDDHPYFQNAAGQVKDLNYKSYGLDSIDELKASKLASADALDTIAQYDQWAKELKGDDDVATLPDNDGLPVMIDDDAFAHVRKNTDGMHWQTSNNLPDLLSDPDESYVLPGNEQKTWMKKYNDRVVLGVATLTQDGWSMDSWYEWNGKPESGNNLRKGILVAKK
jgi:SPP1 gp7 family putative phage head morphogenesis protein